jgi:hypothetical protein
MANPMFVNGEDVNAPFYVNLDCLKCGNHFEIKAVPNWGVSIRGLWALRLTCLKCGTLVGDETFEYKPLEIVSDAQEEVKE